MGVDGKPAGCRGVPNRRGETAEMVRSAKVWLKWVVQQLKPETETSMSLRVTSAAIAFATMAAMLTPATAQPHQAISADDAVRSFAPHIETFIATLDTETDRLDVRINRCTGQRGELSDLMFYVWVGWRGAADNAAEVLEQAVDAWASQDWKITRHRQLDNGGVHIAATDPVTGNSYSLDSGFAADPNTLIVGFFSTQCFEHSHGAAPFGSFAWPG